MDFKAPIDITAVLTAVKKHKDILKAVDKLDASEVLRHFTPVPGITDSLELGKVEGGSISGKYTGKFTAGKYLGKIVPRRLVVRPVVMEMSDEPERYRRTYIAEVPGTLRTKKVNICKALRRRKYYGSSTRHGTNRILLQDKLFEVRRNCSIKKSSFPKSEVSTEK